MRLLRNNTRERRGAIIPLAALLMTLLVGMLAFAIDVGYICAVEAELQNAADSAALAGAQQLQTLYVAYVSPGQTKLSQYYQTATTTTTGPNGETPPITVAQQYAAYNQAGGVYVQVPITDISFSYNDLVNAPIPAQYPNAFPNTITVVTRRDNTANTPLGLFFARIFGVSTINLTATASATIFSGDGGGGSYSGLSLQNIASTSSTGYVSPHILPVALDVNVWQTFFQTGKSPDGNIYTASNGNPQLQVYPIPTNTPGSFGLIDVGVPSNSTPAFRSWIDDGQTPNDISYLVNNNLVPVTPAAPQPWKVGPGLKSTLVSDFQSQMGEPNLLPLFAPANKGSGQGNSGYVAATGNGQNATYAVVGFVGIKITEATGNGNNMNISIQPSAIVDPTLSIPFVQPALNPAAYTTSYTGGMQSPTGGAVASTGTGTLQIYNQTFTNPTNVTATSTFGLPPTTFVSAKLTQ